MSINVVGKDRPPHSTSCEILQSVSCPVRYPNLGRQWSALGLDKQIRTCRRRHDSYSSGRRLYSILDSRLQNDPASRRELDALEEYGDQLVARTQMR